MSEKLIETFISENKGISALETCLDNDMSSFGLLLGKIMAINTPQFYNIMHKLSAKNIVENYAQNVAENDNVQNIDEDTTENTTEDTVEDPIEDTTKDTVEDTTENTVENITEDIVEDTTEYTVEDTTKYTTEDTTEDTTETDQEITIKLYCNWTSSEKLTENWNRMSKGNYTWNNIRMITDDTEPDFFVVINSISDDIKIDKKKTILFRMEPRMEKLPKLWGKWSDPKDDDFYHVFRHETELNNIEWHLSKTYTEFCTEPIIKNPEYDTILSTVLSDKYNDIGHIRRINFTKFLEQNDMKVHVYGSNKWEYKDYKGELPPMEKDLGVFPYKYHFNAENNFIDNYATEKLMDGILGECLVFYSGCRNIREYLDERSYVYLELSNFKDDMAIIQKAIKEDWYTQRLPYIRKMKKKILTEMQFFPRLEKFLKSKKNSEKNLEISKNVKESEKEPEKEMSVREWVLSLGLTENVSDALCMTYPSHILSANELQNILRGKRWQQLADATGLCEEDCQKLVLSV